MIKGCIKMVWRHKQAFGPAHQHCTASEIVDGFEQTNYAPITENLYLFRVGRRKSERRTKHVHEPAFIFPLEQGEPDTLRRETE